MKSLAYEQFPWAQIEPSLTVSGLISHRWTHQRQAWSRVIAGTDEQIATFINEKIPLSPINFNVPEEAATALALHLVPEIERVISKGISLEETRAWYAAWYAAICKTTCPPLPTTNEERG